MPKVLVIDDAPQMRSSLCRLLRKEGFEAVAAGDGLEAMGFVESRPPDLIVLDLNMPHMNGLAVLEKLRTNPLWRTAPVLVFSGSPNEATKKRALELGATEVLLKASVPVSELIDRIRALAGPRAVQLGV